MTINARILITALFLIELTPLWAQNQRLTWVGDEYAMRYEVIIEKEEAGEYNNVLRDFTEDFFIEVSLPSGKYRCQVIPYDFLNQPVPVTEWMDFEILSGNANPGDETNTEIVLTAPKAALTVIMPEAAAPEPAFTAAEPETTAPEPAFTIAEPEVIAPEPAFTAVEPETTAPEPALTAAEPEAAAPEPKKITEYKNQFDLYLSAAWVPLLPIYDESEFLDDSVTISPAGLAVRFAIVSAKQRLLNPGMELSASWRIYTTISGKNAQSLVFDWDMIEQSHFIDDKTAFNFRLGAGVSLISNGDSRWAVGQQYSTHFNIGASLLFLLPKNLFLETDMEYSQFFTSNIFCFFRTCLGLGYRF